VEAVDEFEAERDQERDEEEQERQVVRDLRAGRIDVGIDAVGNEQQDGRNDATENNAGYRVDGAAGSGPLRAGSIEPGNAMSVMGLLVAQSPTLRTVCDSPMKTLRRSPPARAEQSGDGSDNEDQSDERKPDQKRTEQQQAAGRDEHGDHQQQQRAAERADARDKDAMRPAHLDI